MSHLSQANGINESTWPDKAPQHAEWPGMIACQRRLPDGARACSGHRPVHAHVSKSGQAMQTLGVVHIDLEQSLVCESLPEHNTKLSVLGSPAMSSLKRDHWMGHMPGCPSQSAEALGFMAGHEDVVNRLCSKRMFANPSPCTAYRPRLTASMSRRLLA